jgi:hypothetical protein
MPGRPDLKIREVVLALLVTSCSSMNKDGSDESDLAGTPEQEEICYHRAHIPELTWGNNKEVTKYRQYFISGLPTDKTLLYARAAGVSTVVDLRTASREQDVEKGNVESLDMTYISVAVPANGTFDDSVAEKIAAALQNGEEKLFLIHHDGIELAAAWFAVYIGTRSSLNTETSLSIGASVGLQDANLRNRLKEYLDSPAELPVDGKNAIDNTPADSE